MMTFKARRNEFCSIHRRTARYQMKKDTVHAKKEIMLKVMVMRNDLFGARRLDHSIGYGSCPSY